MNRDTERRSGDAPASASISSAIVGADVGPVAQTVDARWLMAYAAALGDDDGRLYDTRAPGGPLAHPLFPVCYEWPVVLALREKTIDPALATRSVHATHHLVIHRPPRAGDALFTAASVIGVARRRGGTLVSSRVTTVDERGAAVTTTVYGSVYRGVSCERDAALAAPSPAAWTTRRPPPEDRADPASSVVAEPFAPAWTAPVDVFAWAAHVYTECARIWNPIHTDIAVAKAAGLPDLILHGTATLALATSRVVTHALGGDPRRVREVAARFTGMVTMPSRLAVRGARPASGRMAFDVLGGAEDRRVLDGWISFHSPDEECSR